MQRSGMLAAELFGEQVAWREAYLRIEIMATNA
jgi:hypothetical protein